MYAQAPDLLRLLAVPVFGWAAYRDLQTRRVPDETWLPLLGLAVLALAWEGWLAYSQPFPRFDAFARVAVFSVLVLVPVAYLLFRIGGFGGADAKAVMVLAVLFPTYPAYYVADAALPVVRAVLGVFSLTVLTNAVLLGACYPVALALRNLATGRVSRRMFVGRPCHWRAATREHGRLLASGDLAGGLDLDALRMYLRYRNVTLGDLRSNPGLRDPATLPATPGDPTDGRLRPAPDADRSAAGEEPAPDGAGVAGGAGGTDAGGTGESRADPGPDPDAAPAAASDGGGAGEYDDPWGAAAFLADLDRSAYGTTPAELRAGLDQLAARETVWVSPGIPFVVPLFAGLVVALTYGDLLVGVLAGVGLA